MPLITPLFAPFFSPLLVVGLALAGCQKEPVASATDTQPPWVHTVSPQPLFTHRTQFSATLRARHETPLAFQVGGRILRRHVDAGHSVATGQTLFELDPADLEQALGAALADLAAAEAAVHTVEADLTRLRALQERGFISAQALQRAELAQREAHSRRQALAARVAQARNARSYAYLKAPASGILVDVMGEPGQVISAGQPVAILARAGAREVEVHLPADLPPPQQGMALLPTGEDIPIELREAAPAVEALGRTRRARYTLASIPKNLPLGSVLKVSFVDTPSSDGWSLPVAALDERGQGPRVWRLREGKIEAVPVHLRAIDGQKAVLDGPLTAGDRIVALGAHLLREGMAVRERQP